MDLSPHLARTVAFRIVRKGYDPAEVDEFRERAATAIETAQNQATAMEARARAAVSKLQEVAQAAKPAVVSSAPAADTDPTPGPAESAASVEVAASASDTETISRTLLLAQRTAERTVAEAEAEAASIIGEAKSTAATELEAAKSEAGRLVDEARNEARRQVESERVAAENEVQSLLAKREFLLSDVEHLEQHIANQRDRIRRAADGLLDLAEHPSSGLGEARRPLLSASAGDDGRHDVAPGSHAASNEERHLAAEPDGERTPAFGSLPLELDGEERSHPGVN